MSVMSQLSTLEAGGLIRLSRVEPTWSTYSGMHWSRRQPMPPCCPMTASSCTWRSGKQWSGSILTGWPLGS